MAIPKRWGILAAHLLVAVLALAGSGCLAAVAGVAAAGGAGYAYYAGKVSRDFQGSLDQVWSATHLALSELGMPVVSQDQAGDGGVIVARAAEQQVRISFEVEAAGPAGQVTRVGVRVATFGEQDLSARILNQIGAHVRPLSPVTVAPTAPTGSSAPPPLADPAPAGTPAAIPSGPVPLSPLPAQTAPPPLASPSQQP